MLMNLMEFETGTRLGRYEIRSPIGRGGMGEVYLAQDTSLRRPVALKLLPARFTSDSDRLQRFEQEAQAASALNHPNIITIHEIGREGPIHFLATEFVEGETLRRRLEAGPLRLSEALDIGVQAAAALSAAHAAGIIHRDVKPENIMITSAGVAKLCDLGLAKQTKGDADVTMDGTSVGTPNYISPEQARGEDKIDIRGGEPGA